MRKPHVDPTLPKQGVCIMILQELIHHLELIEANLVRHHAWKGTIIAYQREIALLIRVSHLKWLR